jgi:phage tail sheath protein FI
LVDTYKHGVYIQEVPTPVIPTRRVNASVPVFVGAAPIWKTLEHRTDGVELPLIAYNYAEAMANLGYSDTWSDYSLCEAMWVFFQIYGMSPAVFINAFDPYGNALHRNAQATITQALVAGSLIVSTGAPAAPVADVLIDNVVVKDQAGAVTHVKDTDYTIAYDGNYNVVISRKVGGAIPSDTATLTILYETAKPSAVTADDVVAALNAVDQVYPRFSVIPGQIVAPKWSINTAVASAMLARATDINDSFRCICVVDIDTDDVVGAPEYTDVNTVKTANSWSDTQMICCWPLVKIGSGASAKTCYMSTHVAGIIASTDYDNGGIPYVSPSNHDLRITGAVVKAGTSVWLGRDQANTLNSQGVVTALNWEGAWRLWGNRTADYPSSTDPKDTFIPNRRMMNYCGNVIVATFFQKVDSPISRRTVATIQDSLNDWLNGLIGQGAILSGSCELLESDNPVTSLIDGQVTFRVNLGLQGPAEAITFILAMDPAAVSALWQAA